MFGFLWGYVVFVFFFLGGYSGSGFGRFRDSSGYLFFDEDSWVRK